MDNARILKGYSKTEQRELEEAKDNGFLSVIAMDPRLVPFIEEVEE